MNLENHIGHGFALAIPNGTRSGAEKIANELLANNFCSELPEIHERNGVWIFLWQPGAEVQSQEIFYRADLQAVIINNQPIPKMWKIFTIREYLEYEKSKV